MLSRQEHLFFQKTQIWVPTPTQRLISTGTGPDTVHIYTCRPNNFIYKHKHIEKKTKNVEAQTLEWKAKDTVMNATTTKVVKF